jgi:hypothetical protein
MDEKLEIMERALGSHYGLDTPKVSMHETFDEGRFRTYLVVDAQDQWYKLVEYPPGNFNDDKDLVRWMEYAEEQLPIAEYEFIEPITPIPGSVYTLYSLTFEEE